MFNQEVGSQYGECIDPAKIEDEDDRACFLNLMYDHCVPEMRAQRFRELCEKHGAVLAARKYREKYILETPSPDFSEDGFNSSNFVDGNPVKATSDRSRPPGELINVINLNGLMGVVDGIKAADLPNYPLLDFKSEQVRDQTNSDKDQAFSNWLDEKLLGAPGVEPPTLAEQQDFVGELLRLIGNNAAGGEPHNPVWVAPFQHFERFLGVANDPMRADRWLNALGIEPPDVPHWQAVLVYNYEQIGDRLYRPTQLDAGHSGYHFPSHLRRALKDGGQTMVLAPNDPKEIPEYIHKQFSGLGPRNVHAVAKTTATGKGSLTDFRARHRLGLAQFDIGSDAAEWYPLHIIKRERAT